MAKQKWNGSIKTIIAIVTVIFLVVGILLSVAKTYYLIPAELEHHIESAKEFYEENDAEHMALELADASLDNQCDKLNDGMARLETEIKYLREDTKEILQYIKSMQK